MLPATLPRLQGDRVVLRDFTDADAALVAEAGRDPLIPLITTVPAPPSGAARPDDDAVAAYLRRQRGRTVEGAGYSFAIAVAGDGGSDGEAVGQIGLWTREIDAGRATIGYWVAEPFRRRGYAVDALRTLTTWAFTHPEVARLQLVIEPWNEGSWRIAEACGFRREGLLRAWEQVGDERRDMWSYARLRGDHPTETG